MTRVLVVEDEESYSDALAYMLRKEGFEVGIAGTGPEAIAEFERAGADIVLLDLMLPDGNGMQLFDDAKSLQNTEVVLITGHASLETSIQALRCGTPPETASMVMRCRILPVCASSATTRVGRSGEVTVAEHHQDGARDLAEDGRVECCGQVQG